MNYLQNMIKEAKQNNNARYKIKNLYKKIKP